MAEDWFAAESVAVAPSGSFSFFGGVEGPVSSASLVVMAGLSSTLDSNMVISTGVDATGSALVLEGALVMS